MNIAIANPKPKRNFFGHGLSVMVAAVVPALWITQLIVNYGLSSYACFPRTAPRQHLLPGWHWLPAILLAINVIVLLVCVWGIFASSRNWRDRTVDDPSSTDDVIETGEGPIKYLDLWGYVVATGFLVVTLFNTLALVMVPSC
ncbi:MAG: hypothetical protein JOZ29_03375 [Deltaproteobacteria bacterium]|nr:hypothetical protein [Deltaproteobacteria bacterium]